MPTQQDIEFSVIVPVFNEERSLALLQKRLHKSLEGLSRRYEIIYVNDGSIDSSLKILSTLKRKYPKIKVISLDKNRGQTEALFAGFGAARGKWIITLDADLQNPPEEIAKLIQYRHEFDFVAGIRKNRKDNLLKKASSAIAHFSRWIILKDTTRDAGCTLRLFKKELAGSLPFFKNCYLYFPFLLKIKGFAVKELDVDHRPRMSGKTKYGIFERAVEGIFGLYIAYRLKRQYISFAQDR